MTLIDLALDAPLVAIAPKSHGVLHAVTMEELVRVSAKPRRTMRAACGMPGMKLFTVPIGADVPIPWPIRVAGIPAGLSRCRECHAKTGRKSPRSQFARREDPKEAPRAD